MTADNEEGDDTPRVSYVLTFGRTVRCRFKDGDYWIRQDQIILEHGNMQYMIQVTHCWCAGSGKSKSKLKGFHAPF